MVLVIMLTVVVNVAHVTYEKIQAQNAADAAALTGGVWQIRGMAFIQSLNNLVYVSDMLASFGLNVGVAGSVASATGVGATLGQPIGNAGLVVCMGAHGFSQFALVPLRDIMCAAWPVVSAVGASEMANRNQARPIIGTLGNMAKGLALESMARSGALEAETDLIEEDALATAGNWLWNLISNQLKLYAIGMEMNISQDLVNSVGELGSLVTDLENARAGAGGDALSYIRGGSLPNLGSIKLAGLHLERITEGYKGWPLVIPDSVVMLQLHFCSMLQPLATTTKTYFGAAKTMQEGLDTAFEISEQMEEILELVGASEEEVIGFVVDQGVAAAIDYVDGVLNPLATGKWKHPYYASSKEFRLDGDQKGLVQLPPSTWFSGGGVSDEQYSERTAMWVNLFNGLGVPQSDGTFGQLGSVACASIVVKADTVEKYPKVIRGWVDMVPVHIIKGKDDSLELGICH